MTTFVTPQGKVELMLFFAMFVGMCLAVAEIWFMLPKPENKTPTTEKDDD